MSTGRETLSGAIIVAGGIGVGAYATVAGRTYLPYGALVTVTP